MIEPNHDGRWHTLGAHQMLQDYPDIRNRLGEPLWYDYNGTPRYDEHQPRLCPDIYARQVVLLRIGCQNECGFECLVQMHSGLLSNRKLDRKTIHYGDPPQHEQCASGCTMNCNDLAVVEWWEKNEKADWVRMPEHEGPVDEDDTARMVRQAQE